MVEQARPQQLNNGFPLPAGDGQPADAFSPTRTSSPSLTQNSKLKTQNSSDSLSPTYNLKLNTYNSPSPLRVVAAIPCYNTEKTIAEVVAKTKEYVDQVVVIDDGSSDMTAVTARSAGATVISHDKNRGKGAAMKTAMAGIDADVLVFVDGDGQHNPADIPKLLEPILQGNADFVIGSRYLSDSNRSNNPFHRKASNAAASFVITFVISVMQPISRFLSRQKLQNNHIVKSPISKNNSNCRLLNGKLKWVTDCTSGFTAQKKTNCSELNLTSNGFQIETEMIFEQAKNGFSIAEVPIDCKWGESASNLSIAKDAMRTISLLFRKLVHYSTAKAQITSRSDIAIKERGIS
jgi:hypothetical protein